MKYAHLVPELVCSDFAASLAFYTEVLGFIVVYARPEERFAYLDREGAQLMLEQPVGRSFVNSELQHPYGRGVNFEIEVSDVEALYERVRSAGAPIFLPIETKWYARGAVEAGNRQFIVEDPDGYLLRFAQDLGERGLSRLRFRVLSSRVLTHCRERVDTCDRLSGLPPTDGAPELAVQHVDANTWGREERPARHLTSSSCTRHRFRPSASACPVFCAATTGGRIGRRTSSGKTTETHRPLPQDPAWRRTALPAG